MLWIELAKKASKGTPGVSVCMCVHIYKQVARNRKGPQSRPFILKLAACRDHLNVPSTSISSFTLSLTIVLPVCMSVRT